MARRVVTFLEGMPKLLCNVIAVALTFSLGYVDTVTGGLSFSLFYTAPLALVGWRGSRARGVLHSILIVIVRIVSREMRRGWRPLEASYLWNVPVWLLYYLLFVFLLAGLRDAQRRLGEQARRDPLTGLLNRRAFLERLLEEQQRARRSQGALTILFIDLDGFKAVNDTLGHDEGDAVLREVAGVLSGCLRVTDPVGRLGGDEFAVALPDTDASQAQRAVAKLRGRLLEAMQRRSWKVSASIGCLTCVTVSLPAEEMLAAADELMYSAKKAGKDRVAERTLG